MCDLHLKAADQLANDGGWKIPDGTRIVVSLTQSPHTWSPDLMKIKPLAMAIWTRETGNVNLRPFAAKGSMKTNSMCIGHTKLNYNYTVKCSSASGIVCFGIANAWLARQPWVSPLPANNESSFRYVTIWYLPAGASKRIITASKAKQLKVAGNIGQD
eukprot:16441442-Heterocapsa_arctica.AAC.1